MSAQANFWSSTDVVSQLLSEIPTNTKTKSKFPNYASAEAKYNPIVSHIQDYGNVHFIFPFKYLILAISVLLTLVKINVKKFNIESYSKGDMIRKHCCYKGQLRPTKD